MSRPRPSEDQFAAGRAKAKAARKADGFDYWAGRRDQAASIRAKWQAALARRKRKLEWARKQGRLDLVARHETAIARLAKYVSNAVRKERRAKRKADLDVAFKQQDRRVEALDPAKVDRKWKQDRKESEKQDRVARRDGRDRSGFEGRREEVKQPGRNPLTGSADVLNINARHDVLQYLLSRRKITDPEKLAGDRFRRLCEIAGFAGPRGVDYGRTGMGTPGPRTPVTDTMLNARDELDRIEKELGSVMFNLLVRVIHYGVSLKEMAEFSEDIDRGAQNK